MAIRPRTWLTPLAAGAVILAGAPAVLAATPAPNPVTNVSVVERDGAAVVSWKKPAKGAPPTSYVVTSSPASDGCKAEPARKGAAVPTTCTVRGLRNGTAYTFTVTARNGSAKSDGVRSAKSTPASSELTITGSLSGGLTKADGSACANSGPSSWTIEMNNPGGREAECRLRVVAILADGRAYTSNKVASASRTFSVVVPAPLAQRKDVTLHITRADGSYVGPIILARKTIKTKTFGVLGLGDNHKGRESLGAISLSSVSGSAVTAFGLVADFAGSQGGVLSCLTAGAPSGAGKGGYVKKASSCVVPTVKSRAARSAAAPQALPQPIVSNCETWANSQGSAALSQNCYDAMASAWGNAFRAVCGAGTVGKSGQWIINNNRSCANFIDAKFNDGGNGNNNGNNGGNNNGNDNGNGNSDPCAKASSGGDQDNDGIPSAVDVDDNGNGVVDIADPNVNGDCTVEPSKFVRTAIGDTYTAASGRPTPVNYAAVTDGLIASDQFDALLDELLSGPNFGIGYFIFKTDFFPGAEKVGGVMPAVWVSCAGIVWCDPATSRATLGTNVDMKNAVGVTPSSNNSMGFFEYGINSPWSSAGALSASQCSSEEQGSRYYRTPCWSEIDEPMRFGSAADSCNGADSGELHYDPTYSAPAAVPSDARNFFWTTICSMGGMLRTVSGGGISPNISLLGDDVSARDAVSAFDILTLNYLADGRPSSIATTLGAYPITAPMIRSFNGQPVNYSPTAGERILGATGGSSDSRRAVVLNATDKRNLTIVFNRPQREAFPGEDSVSGLHDLHGMNYGIEFEVGPAQFGCGAGNGQGGMPTVSSAYAVDSTLWNERAVDGSYASFLAPLRDTKVADSPTEEPGVATMTITLDVRKCIEDRAAWLWNDYGIDVGDMNLPNSAVTDGTAMDWKGQTGLQNNGDTTCITANLNARGEARTGGTDSAIQSFCLQFEPGTIRGVAP